MSIKNQTAINEEHLARAKAKDVPVSTKHSIELCRYLRYKTTNTAKKILEETITLKKPIPFKRFKKDVGHKPGMAAGRFPKKAAKEILKLVKSAETNAQFKGLNTSSLKIIKILANKASVPVTGGRRNTSTKRTNLEIEVKEKREKKTERREESKKEVKTEVKENKPAAKLLSENEKLSNKSENGLENLKDSQKGLEESKSPQKEGTVKKETKVEKEETVREEEKEIEKPVEKKETEKEKEEIKKPAETVKETKTGEPEK